MSNQEQNTQNEAKINLHSLDHIWKAKPRELLVNILEFRKAYEEVGGINAKGKTQYLELLGRLYESTKDSDEEKIRIYSRLLNLHYNVEIKNLPYYLNYIENQQADRFVQD